MAGFFMVFYVSVHVPEGSGVFEQSRFVIEAAPKAIRFELSKFMRFSSPSETDLYGRPGS